MVMLRTAERTRGGSEGREMRGGKSEGKEGPLES
jgi:hypothetical protein